MARFSAEQIYVFARQAGFSPDQAATMTAVALAESGGNSGAHNPRGEDSRGLWQINARAHPDLARRYDLYDPVQNARAAFEVSRRGTDISPWTVTHGGSSARYLRYRGEAEAAAVAYGDGGGHGVWTGTPGYGHPVAAGAASAPGPDRPALETFLGAARAQVGDDYVYGAEVNLNDPNPSAFDCSELTQWAAYRAGLRLPETAEAQFLYLKQRGLLIPVEQGKRTPGALLFTFDREPRPGEASVPGAHVGISLGNGRTVEAANPRTDVGEFNAGNRFRYAALLPGISDGSPAAPPMAPPYPAPDPPVAPPAPDPPPAVDPLPVADPMPVAEPLLDLGGPDADGDGLTDAYERRYGLDPLNVDTDGDNLSDSYERVTSHTDAHRADSDGDLYNDAFELARGLDPMTPDTEAGARLDGGFPVAYDDPERGPTLGARVPDADADGFVDGLEMRVGSDPMSARSTPLDHDPLADPLHAGDGR